MEFFRNHKFACKLIIGPLLICFLTVTVFFTVNKPIKTHAEAFTAIALGTGALVALVASYFATAGVQVTNNGGSESYVEGFFNDIIDQYKQSEAEHQQFLDTYFNDQGQFIGSEEDLQFIIGENANGYWQMGKGMTSLMEDIKSWFVSSKTITSTPQTLVSNFSIPANGSSYCMYPYTGYIYDTPDFVSVFESGGSATISFNDDYFINIFNINVVHNSNDDTWTFAYQIYDSSLGSVQTKSVSVYSNGRPMPLGIIFCGNKNNVFDPNQTLTLQFCYGNSSGNYWNHSLITSLKSLSYFDGSAISLDGALTDGYQDFQDALDQDLANESDNDQAVVQVGVGSMEGVLTGEEVTEKLLEQATANTLEGTYEGVYENQQEATDDKEGEKPFNPTYPNGWVPITGLQNFFPFCIPWDIYAVLGMLQADPEAPVIEWEFSFGHYADPYKITLDFNRYNTLASVLRASLFVLFLIGLVLKTRNLIKG